MNKLKVFKINSGMVLIVTILIGVIVHLATGNFFTSYNISTLTRQRLLLSLLDSDRPLCC